MRYKTYKTFALPRVYQKSLDEYIKEFRDTIVKHVPSDTDLKDIVISIDPVDEYDSLYMECTILTPYTEEDYKKEKSLKDRNRDLKKEPGYAEYLKLRERYKNVD